MDTRDDVKSRWFKTRQLLQSIQNSPFWSHRWLGWAFVYVSVLLVFLVDRSVGLSALIEMYGSDKDHTLGVTLGALGLGMLEDWICATYLVAVLWLIDFFLSQTLGASSDSMTLQTFIKWKRQRILRRGVTFVTSWLLFVATAAPFAVDMMLVRLRSMRFTFEIVSMAIAESDMAQCSLYLPRSSASLPHMDVMARSSHAGTRQHPLLHLGRRIWLTPPRKTTKIWTPKEENNIMVSAFI
ncbi:sulfatase-like protein [Phytophthora infestans T30-4]|uniref:Sulfatase-like protein n=1 Tax=Phytophthora infestans (strain T30-4) TaxID=403677 RepID=D0RMD6_PHYIT|nr:sulfatase-like protein [Phytophthora infestans T30-4]EEY62345.1 sulfatase-like protein [Phytophthora infestans T30-4]|eukprot:XP_002909794.1 sulfatase-like protein [Phytophthora infestans T30-4]